MPVNTEIYLPQWGERRYVRTIYFAWSGRIDLVAHCNGMARIVDHKTTSIEGDRFVQDFQLSNQTQGYVWAAKQLWPELNIKGFCLNALALIRPKTGSFTGPLDARGPRGGEPPFRPSRHYFEYSDIRLEQWVNNCRSIISDFVHCLVRNDFPMHTKWCFGKYGRCSYHDLCTIDSIDVRMRLLQSPAFKDVTWNPTAGR